MVLGSEIRDPEKTYSGSRIQGSKSTRSWIPDPDPQHWIQDRFFQDHGSRTDVFESLVSIFGWKVLKIVVTWLKFFCTYFKII